MKISTFGAGYVGLVTSSCLAELGNRVVCCDTSTEKIQKLRAGQIPFFEPGLEELAFRNQKAGRLAFTTDPKEAIEQSEIIFIAVGTPSLPDGSADISAVFNVAKSIGQFLKNGRVIIVTKSTVSLGTTPKVRGIIKKALEKRGMDLEFAVVNNPEFLRQGRAVEDSMVPDRIVIGAAEAWAKETIKNLYTPLIKNGHPIIFMDLASSEITKYAANTFIASRISLMNELAQLCEKGGADIELVRRALGTDHRIGSHYIYPGVGYGGSCFPKDIKELAVTAKKLGLPASMVDAIEAVNEKQKQLFSSKITAGLKSVKGKKIAVWGLSFKPNTDDMRCAPSIDIIKSLQKQGAKVSAFDPVATQTAKSVFGDKIEYCKEMYQPLKGAAALVLVTEWPQFKEPDFEKIKNLLVKPVIFDGRNIYSPDRMKSLGFNYFSIGRPTV